MKHLNLFISETGLFINGEPPETVDISKNFILALAGGIKTCDETKISALIV